MARAFISVGSNINPRQNVRAALHLLGHHSHVSAVSTVYHTEAEGRPSSPWFYNCVVEIETELPPEELKFLVLRKIEEDLGRERTGDKHSERPIDLDLILYDELKLETDDLTLPDPQILSRAFVAVPLNELAPGLRLPGTDSSLDAIAGSLPHEGLRPLADYTELLRKDLEAGGQD